MSKIETKKHLYSLTLDDLKNHFEHNSLVKYGAEQIYRWLYKQFVTSTENWTNVSKKTREHIDNHFDLSLPKIVLNRLSVDGTRKFLVQMNDGKSVEAVLIPSDTRRTLCISSQIGCAIGCTFCYTGKMGLDRNLRTEEIVGQFVSITNWLIENSQENIHISNIVYMGQGEPLHNYENVKQATKIFLEASGPEFGQRKITLSTSGLVPQLEKLCDFPPVNIAISLHSIDDNVRSMLMPVNKRYNLERLFKTINKIPLKAHRKITYEYLLIDGLNDRLEDIKGLEKILNKNESKINLIPFNEHPGTEFKKPSDKKINWFKDQLLSRGLTCTIRASKGEDIMAACGQLNGLYNDSKKK